VVTLGTKVMGLVVDGVSDVIAIPAADVEPPPSLTGHDSSVVHGLAHVGDRLVMLLDLDATLRLDESLATTDT
jgi:purine-binding chemotaxis protein CheW